MPGTPAKSVQRQSSPPRGASPALSRVPSDLPGLRRPSDFGSPGVAVATAPSRPALSLRAQDDAMEMLLQVAAAALNLALPAALEAL